MPSVAACKGGTVMMGNCRNCRAIAASRVTQPTIPFLPPGAWVIQNPSIGGSGGSGGTPQQVRHRWSFLRSLRPETEIAGQWFNGHGEYRAFVFRRQSDGKSLGLIEADLESNALYVFDATKQDWLVVAQYDKGQLRPAVRPSACIRLVYHNDTWQTRVQRLLV